MQKKIKMTYKYTEEEKVNLKFWNEVAEVHYAAYDLEPLRQRKSTLIDKVQKEVFYPVDGKSLLHLQCHIGTDTLSLALDGADVTGIDFSEDSIACAKRLSEEMDIPGTFISGSVYDAPEIIGEKFDVVYTGKGALMWLPDIVRWAEVVAACLKPGGTFYVIDVHPIFFNCEEDEENKRYKLETNYFKGEKPHFFDEPWPDYADKDHVSPNPTYEWNWTLAEIVNSLINAGLVIERLEEMEHIFYKALPSFVRVPDQEEAWYFWPENEKKLPLSYAIKASKPVKNSI